MQAEELPPHADAPAVKGMSLERQFSLASDLRLVDEMSFSEARSALRATLHRLAAMQHFCDALKDQVKILRRMTLSNRPADQDSDRERMMDLARQMRALMGLPADEPTLAED
jgi:hypothetical protein